jgi:hypothetical protein
MQEDKVAFADGQIAQVRIHGLVDERITSQIFTGARNPHPLDALRQLGI